jgi:class 3 adenylate cyclase
MADDATAVALGKLRTALRAVWRFGSVVLIGWTPSGNGIEVLAVPVTRLFEQVHRHRRLMVGDRRMGQRTFEDVARQLGMEPVEIRTSVPVGDQPGEIALKYVEAAVTLFSMQHTDQRAVFLVDIVGFSLLAPEQQALQLTTLEFAFNLAAATAREQMRAPRLVRSTTGDGFYVWSSEKGLEADLSVLAIAVMTLTYLGCLRRLPASAGVPTLRCCFGVGSHYTYRQPGIDGTSDTEFIVGQVTIQLARLIGVAQPNQILMGDFLRREPGSSEALDAVVFLAEVSERVGWLRGLALPGSRIERVSLYLTGARDGEGFEVDALDVVDKHGLSHRCFNMKVNVFLSDGEPFYCGLTHEELTEEGDGEARRRAIAGL